jgi:hypothetical protein
MKSLYFFAVLRIRIHMFLGLPDPDPSIIMQNSKKTLDSYYFVTLFDFLSLKNDVNVPSKSDKQKKLCKQISYCWHLEGQCRKSISPDPLVRGMDPRIRIRIRIHPKLSWIRNTAFLCVMFVYLDQNRIPSPDPETKSCL